MSKSIDVTFSIHGDMEERGIFLHFDGGKVRIKIGETIEDFQSFRQQIEQIEQEIKDNYYIPYYA
jgi:hypothetical protein